MSVDIEVGTEKFNNVSEYSVVEDSSPTNPADSRGGVGAINFGTIESPMSRLLVGKTLKLRDGYKGTTEGVVSEVSSTDGLMSISSESRLSRLLIEQQVPPFTGNLRDAFLFYFELANVTERVQVDESLASIPVRLIGFYGELWDFVNKKLCPVYEVEIALVSDNVVVRPVRQNEVVVKRDSSRRWSVNRNNLAQNVEVYYYQPAPIVNGLVYPYGGYNNDLQIYQVDAGEETEIEIPVDVSLTSVVQPTPVIFVGPNYSAASVYTVIGNDGKPIPPQQWVDQGGSVRVSIGEDTRTMILTLKGASEERYAPYRLALASGSGGNYYSTLRVLGSGIGFSKELIRTPTGVSAEETANEVGVTVDNPAIETLSQAYSAALKAGKDFSGSGHSIAVTSFGVNRLDSSGDVRYPDFDQFEVMFTGTTFDEWEAEWTGRTFNDFQDEMYDLVRDEFYNQAFGNVAGSRVRNDHSWFRVRSATTTEGQVSYTAEGDTLFDDLSEFWSGSTFDDWQAEWSGKTFDEFALIPLWRA